MTNLPKVTTTKDGNTAEVVHRQTFKPANENHFWIAN